MISGWVAFVDPDQLDHAVTDSENDLWVFPRINENTGTPNTQESARPKSKVDYKLKLIRDVTFNKEH